MGFDAWLDNEPSGRIKIETSLITLDVSLHEIGLEDTSFDAGGLDRKIQIYRLPNEALKRELSFAKRVKINKERDNPIWVCVTTEDGYQAWSSPIYLFK